MRKSIITIIVFTIALCGFNNIATAGGTGGIGLKVGPNISTFGTSDEDFSEAKNRFGLGVTVGLGYEFATESFFAFELEALYELRGYKQDIEVLNTQIGIAHTFTHFLKFPATAKFYIGDVFNIHVGGFVGVAVGGKILLEGQITNVLDDEYDLFGSTIDPQGDDYLNRLDGGIHLGFEFVSQKGFGAGARGYLGLADITNDAHVWGNGVARTGEISLYAIFRFGGTK